MAVLVVSMLAWVPGQSPTMRGASWSGTGLVAWLIVATIHVRAVRGQVGPHPAALAVRIVTAQMAVLPLLAAGV